MVINNKQRTVYKWLIIVNKYGFIEQSEPINKKDKKELNENYTLLVVREFIHHLSAEHRYKQER